MTFMNFIFFCLGTSAISYVMDFTNGIRLMKDIVDAGYKIDIKRMNEFQEEVLPEMKKTMFLERLIPIFNMMQSMQRTSLYNKNRNLIIESFDTIGILEELSETEKQEYSKNPTKLNALLIMVKSDKQITNINKDNLKGRIIYEIDESTNEITIIKTTGNISNLSIEEQKDLVRKNEIAESSPDSTVTATYNNKENTNTNTTNNSDTKLEISIKQKIEELKKLRDELIAEEENTKKESIEKGKVLEKDKK